MNAVIIGNSDGIGLRVSRRLLDAGWSVIGISRSTSPLDNPAYTHHVVDVRDEYFVQALNMVWEEASVDLCIHCVGIEVQLDVTDMSGEPAVFGVNLTSMVKTAAVVIPRMVARGQGHFLGLSSQADAIHAPKAPSYNASKAGYSSYLESLALAVKAKGVAVSSVRFGFVDTKMAQEDWMPFMMSVDAATEHIMTCIRRRPARYTAPWSLIPLVTLLGWIQRIKLRFGRRTLG